MHISDYDVVRHKFEMDFDKFNIALYSVSHACALIRTLINHQLFKIQVDKK